MDIYKQSFKSNRRFNNLAIKICFFNLLQVPYYDVGILLHPINYYPQKPKFCLSSFLKYRIRTFKLFVVQPIAQDKRFIFYWILNVSILLILS